MRFRQWLTAGFVCLILSAQAQNSALPPADCSHAIQISEAARTIERNGIVLESTQVKVMDPLPRQLLREDTRVRYQIPVTACQGTPELGLWIYRIGAPYRIWGDGQPLRALQPLAEPGEHVYNGRLPTLFLLPTGTRHIDIEFATIPYLNYGLIRLELGPQQAIAVSRAVDYNALTTFNDTSTAVIGVVAILAIGLWIRRRQDRQILWLGLAALAWVCRGASYQFFTISFSPLLYESINPFTIFLTCAGTSASAFYSLGVMSPLRGRAMGLLTLLICTGFVLANTLEAGGFLVRSFAYLSGFVLIGIVITMLFRRRHQSNGKESIRLILFGYAALLTCALHDIGMVIGYVSPDHWSLNSLGFTTMLLAYTLSGSQYMVRSLNRAEQSNQELEQTIAAKSVQLEASYSLLKKREYMAARLQEREHLLREMHDGLGAQLMTAMRGLERGTLARDQVLLALQDSLDDLRLLMDSTDLGQELQGALATWRHRWNPRLEALGLQLDWHVDDGLDAAKLRPDAVLQVMRILQEATVNVVKHAQATRIQISASWSPTAHSDHLTLTVQDNGIGLLTADTPQGRGLRNMAARANLIGGNFQLTSVQTGGTLASLSLPCESGHQATANSLHGSLSSR